MITSFRRILLQCAICEQNRFRDTEELFRFFLKCRGWYGALMQPFAERAGMDADPAADIAYRQIMNHAQACQNPIANRRTCQGAFHEAGRCRLTDQW